jgi:hypothetical protein
MGRLNLQTWTRLARLDLQTLCVKIGNAALAQIRNWPESGEGRQVKEETEKIMVLLDRTHSRKDILHSFEILDQVMTKLKKIETNRFFQSHISEKMFVDRAGKTISFGQSIRDSVTSFDTVSAHRPARVTSTQSERREAPPKKDTEGNEPKQLSEIVPPQQEAPLQFEVSDGKLRVRPQKPKPDNHDLHNIKSAKLALEEGVERLLASLSESNCDPRLLQAIEEIENTIRSETDVIKLGIANVTCEYLFHEFAQELPAVAAAQFRGLNTAIGMYVSQFPEWHRFTENAASVEFTDQDINQIYRSGANMLPELRAKKGLVDPEVPRSLELILEALKNPGKSRRRAVFGAIRTLENLFAKIFEEFGGLFQAVSQGGRAGVKYVATASTAALLGSAVLNASDVAPTLERVLDVKWLRHASDSLKDALSDSGPKV